MSMRVSKPIGGLGLQTPAMPACPEVDATDGTPTLTLTRSRHHTMGQGVTSNTSSEAEVSSTPFSDACREEGKSEARQNDGRRCTDTLWDRSGQASLPENQSFSPMVTKALRHPTSDDARDVDAEGVSNAS